MHPVEGTLQSYCDQINIIAKHLQDADDEHKNLGAPTICNLTAPSTVDQNAEAGQFFTWKKNQETGRHPIVASEKV